MADAPMTPTTLAETILRDVTAYNAHEVEATADAAGNHSSHKWLHEDEVLAALTAALDPALSERAGEVLERLQKADEYEPLGHDGWDAADLITALLARIAAMEAQIKGLEGGIEAACDREAETERKLRTALAASETRAEAAEAQIAALTARVEGLTGAIGYLISDMEAHDMGDFASVTIARAALTTENQTNG